MLAALFSRTTSSPDLAARIVGSIIISVIVLALAHRLLSLRGRRSLIALVTFVAGLFFALEFFLPTHSVAGKQRNFLTDFIAPATLMLSVIGSFMVGLGVYSLTQVHGRNVLRRRPGWHNSAAFFVAMVTMFIFTLWDYYYKVPDPVSTVLPYPKAIYEILFNGLYMPLQATTFSLLAFYIASAAYRAFRIRSAEAALMMAAASIVMLGQVPLGTWLTHWIPQTGPLAFLGFFRVERLGDWIMGWWNSAAQRGITFGVAVGALAMSLRIWLSLERGAFFSEGLPAQPEPVEVGSVTET